jgi:hypothetical protein
MSSTANPIQTPGRAARVDYVKVAFAYARAPRPGSPRLPGATTPTDASGRTPRSRSPWLVLVVACLAQFMVVLDLTVVNVALPSVQRGLHFSAANL